MNDDTDLGHLRRLVSAASQPSACPTAETLARGASGELAVSERQALADHLTTCASCSEEYRVAASLGAWAKRASGEIELPDRERRSFAVTRWPVLATAAAAVVTVGMTATLVVWALSLRAENARLTAALDDSAQGAAARAAETDAREKAQTTAIEDMQARLADMQAPALNVPIIDLLPRDGVRGSATETLPEVPAGSHAVTFVITSASNPASRNHGLEIVGPSGDVLWRGSGLRPNAERTFTVTVPRALLPAGTCRLRLFTEQSGSITVIAEYAVRVDP